MAQMCARLSVVMDMLGPSDTWISTQLGYTNQTTLSQMRRGMTFPDVEKLASFGQLVVAGGISPNLHWVLTGFGCPFVTNDRKSNSALLALNELAKLKYEASGIAPAPKLA